MSTHPRPPRPGTLAEAAEAFLADGRGRGLAQSTTANYAHSLGLALPVLARRGCRRPADVVTADLDAVLDLAREQGRTLRSRVQFGVLLKGFFAWLHDRGRIITDPAEHLALPDDGEAELPAAPLDEADVRALLAGLPRGTVAELRTACLLELLYGCALRIGEAVALDLADVDLGVRTVTVRHAKHAQSRALPLMGTAEAAVRDWLALRPTLLKGPDRGEFFITQYGKRLKRGSVYRFFDDLNAQRSPDQPRLSPHSFRHALAVHLLRGGADVRHVQQLLGHASLDTTKVYLRLLPGHLREAYDKALPTIAVGIDEPPRRL